MKRHQQSFRVVVYHVVHLTKSNIHSPFSAVFVLFQLLREISAEMLQKDETSFNAPQLGFLWVCLHKHRFSHYSSSFKYDIK